MTDHPSATALAKHVLDSALDREQDTHVSAHVDSCEMCQRVEHRLELDLAVACSKPRAAHRIGWLAGSAIAALVALSVAGLWFVRDQSRSSAKLQSLTAQLRAMDFGSKEAPVGVPIDRTQSPFGSFQPVNFPTRGDAEADNAIRMLAAGIEYGNKQDYPAAVRAFDGAIEEWHQVESNRSTRSPAYQELGSRLKARALAGKGKALSLLGKTADAARALTQAIELDPSLSDTWFTLGVIRSQLAKEEALPEAKNQALHHEIEAYDAAVRADPENANAWFNMGRAWFDIASLNSEDTTAEPFRKAGDAFLQAADLRLSEFMPQYAGGLALWKSSRFEDAVRCLQRATKLKPEHHTSRVILGHCAAEMLLAPLMAEQYDALAQVNPEQARVLIHGSDNFEGLAKLADRIAAVDESPARLLVIGLIRALSGDTATAQAIADRLQPLNPESAQLIRDRCR